MLLIVAITTDYWEYRGFNRDTINKTFTNMAKKLGRKPRVTFYQPEDTKSYITVSHFSVKEPAYEDQVVVGETVENVTEYQPPAFLTRTVVYNVTYNATYGNVTIPGPIKEEKTRKYVIVLFEQYGNLFRDCDSLEGISGCFYYYYYYSFLLFNMC